MLSYQVSLWYPTLRDIIDSIHLQEGEEGNEMMSLISQNIKELISELDDEQIIEASVLQARLLEDKVNQSVIECTANGDLLKLLKAM